MSRAAALAFAAQATWAIRESALDAQIRALLSPGSDSAPTKRPKAAARTQRGVGPTGSIGVIGVYGVITHRPNVWSWLFGGTTIVDLRAALAEMLDEARVGSIALEFDSPGGEVSGLIEFAAELRAARARKPIIAFVNTMCCSAAYWLACQCDEILTTPSAEVGSVGVLTCHGDFSKMNERIGYKPTYIYAGQHKVEGNQDEPLTDEARAYLQESVDRVYGQFVGDIVRGRRRGLTEALVRRHFGEGRVVAAEDALVRKMADRLFAMPMDALAHMATGAGRLHASAEDEDVDLWRMRLDLMALGGSTARSDRLTGLAAADRDALDLL